MHPLHWCPRVWSLALAMLAATAVLACGSENLVLPGSIGPTETPTPVETPACLSSGDACTAADCCSGACITNDGVDFFCE